MPTGYTVQGKKLVQRWVNNQILCQVIEKAKPEMSLLISSWISHLFYNGLL